MSTRIEPGPTFELAPYRSLEDELLAERIESVRRQLGSELLILGHHYQQDAVIEHSDLRGDSYQLSKMAADNSDCRWIVFCGVHFMAETADIVANRPEKVAERDGRRVEVILPDLAAGCSMADMAAIEQVEAAWEDLAEVVDTDEITPITYINSAASLKSFCGQHGGAVCTSSNAAGVLEWAFERRRRVLFFPDQHLGRNTALAMGISNDRMPVWDPHADELGGNEPEAIEQGQVILWKGHCSVHQMFQAEHVHQFRQQYPEIQIIVHPECPQEVNDLADISGSTGKIIETVGAGQAEIRVVAFADRILLVDGPDRGDIVQAEKAGIMELADIVAINKSDLPNSRQAADSVRTALEVGGDSGVAVHLVSAHDGSGIEELLDAIESCSASGARDHLRVRERLLSAWDSRLLGHSRLNEVIDALETGSITLDKAVEIFGLGED